MSSILALPLRAWSPVSRSSGTYSKERLQPSFGTATTFAWPVAGHATRGQRQAEVFELPGVVDLYAVGEPRTSRERTQWSR